MADEQVIVSLSRLGASATLSVNSVGVGQVLGLLAGMAVGFGTALVVGKVLMENRGEVAGYGCLKTVQLYVSLSLWILLGFRAPMYLLSANRNPLPKADFESDAR